MLLIHVFTAKHNPACHLLGRSRLNPSVTASLRLPFLLCIDFPGLHGSWCEGVSLPLRILTQVVQASFSRPLRKIAIIDQDYSISLSLEPYYLCQRKIFSADPRIKKSSQGAKLAANSPNQGRYWRGRGLPRCVKLDSFTLQSSFLISRCRPFLYTPIHRSRTFSPALQVFNLHSLVFTLFASVIIASDERLVYPTRQGPSAILMLVSPLHEPLFEP